MNEIKFTIPVKPLPYKNLTRDERYLMGMSRNQAGPAMAADWEKVQAYNLYKQKIETISLQHEYPRSPSKGLHMHVDIYFGDKKHGNPVNYWQCVAVSCFKSSKHVAGSFDYYYDDTPRVEIIIRYNQEVKQRTTTTKQPETIEDWKAKAF
ncbi:hypothetical protein LCGC14_1290740 [marine sediment metagenome]|uniref:Uncharacterized protein n=1 Tax=marine sediment metagenome TaxID=412755 RepID=A0A0F9KSN6_9ZZZZ